MLYTFCLIQLTLDSDTEIEDLTLEMTKVVSDQVCMILPSPYIVAVDK